MPGARKKWSVVTRHNVCGGADCSPPQTEACEVQCQVRRRVGATSLKPLGPPRVGVRARVRAAYMVGWLVGWLVACLLACLLADGWAVQMDCQHTDWADSTCTAAVTCNASSIERAGVGETHRLSLRFRRHSAKD